MSNTQQKKRETSPATSEALAKKSRLDTIYDSDSSEEHNYIDPNSTIGAQTPIQERRHSSFFERGYRCPRSPTTSTLERHSHLMSGSGVDLGIVSEEEEEEDLFNDSGRFYRRPFYNELFLSSNVDSDFQQRMASLLENEPTHDDETDNFESKTTLPLSRSYARPGTQAYEDEIDAFFSNHNPPNEPEFALDPAIQLSLLQYQQRYGPAWITYKPHYLTQEYFENYTIKDQYIPIEMPDDDVTLQELQNTVTVFDSQFTILKNIGTGEFAEVWKVQCPETNVEYALKRSKNKFTDWEDRWLKIIEVHHLRKVQHSKHCIHLFNAWEEQACLYIQLELCSNGNLEDYIKFKKGRIDKKIVWDIFYEIVLGVKDIHAANLVHLDLKPANIFIDEAGCIKIGDFGISAQTPVDERLLKGEGDRRYMAPDLLRENFNKPADIFSLGLILLELSTGVRLPGTGESWEMLRVGDFSKYHRQLSRLPPNMTKMIEWLLTTEARYRPKIDDILNHPTIKRIQSNYEEYSLSKHLDDLPPSNIKQQKRRRSYSTVEESV